MRRGFVSVLGIASLVLAISTLYATPVLAYPAFPGYGTGTEAKPYRIDTCAELQWINNNLSAHYVLASNVDCSDFPFETIAPSDYFTGTLDGQNHSIKNLTSHFWGLFGALRGATIKNLSIVGNSSGGYASIATSATDTTLANLHSSMTITAMATFGAGLVGYMIDGSTLENSSYTGALTLSFDIPAGSANVGGLVSSLRDGSSITNSFSQATIVHAVDTGEVGGIAGIIGEESTLTNVYSAGTLQVHGDPDFVMSPNFGASIVGGLTGSLNGSIANSFSALGITIQDESTDVGGIAGDTTNSTSTNNFFDAYQASTTHCSWGDTIPCTPINETNTDADYFKNNTSNGPLGTWDFNHIWAETAGYPTLRDLSDFNEPAGIPNSGDSNNDGVQDSYQGYVAPINDGGTDWTTVEVPEATACTIGNTQSIASSSLPTDSGYAAVNKLHAFNIYCPSPGSTVPVTLIFNNLHDVGSFTLRHYNSHTHSYTTVPNVSFGLVTIRLLTA